MRILQIANFVSPSSGGLKVAIDALKVGYEAQGWIVGQITPFSSLGDTNGLSDITSLPLPFSGSYRVILRRQALKRAIRDFRPDVVELSDKSTLAWVTRWCSSVGIPCCVISHERMDFAIQRTGFARHFLKYFNKRWTAQIADNATLVVCASNFASEEFVGTSASIKIIPLGVKTMTDVLSPSKVRANCEIRVVMCCRLSEEKQPKLCIDAVRSLSLHHDVALTIIGDGPMRPELEKLAQGLNVRFLGHVSDRANVMRLVSEADVALSLGYAETFGLTTVEALSVGTPVVVASTGASREIVDDSCGRIVASNATAIADAIVDLVSEHLDPQRQHCIERAQLFDIYNTINNFCNTYIAITSERQYATVA